jgi:hypothetical protein
MIGRIERLLKPGRCRCAVPGCNRSVALSGTNGRITEWLCPKHWRHVTPIVKRIHRKRQQMVNDALQATLDGSDMSREEFENLQRKANVIWEAAKREAIEIAMGIG